MAKTRYGDRGPAEQRSMEQAVIARIQDALQDDQSVNAIVRDLNGGHPDYDGEPRFRSDMLDPGPGIPGPGGGKWHSTAVQRVKDELEEQELAKNQQDPGGMRDVKPGCDPRADGEAWLLDGYGCPPAWCEEPIPEWMRTISAGPFWKYRSREDGGGEDGGYWEDVADGDVAPLSDQECRRMMEEREQEQIARQAMRRLMLEEGTYRFPMPTWRSDLLEAARAPGVKASWIGSNEWVTDAGWLGRAGKDTWDRGVDVLVAEQTRHTGKDAHRLLDQIEGQAGVKGPLRTCLYGILRELALQRQANLALRQAVVRLSSAERPASG